MDKKHITERLALLRKEIHKEKITGYIISTTDEFLSEYAPECYKRLEYITGFTGSNGLAIILESTTLFFTDGRYFTQAQQQLPKDEFQIFDLKEIIKFQWDQYIQQESIIGFDPKIFTTRLVDILQSINPVPIERNLIDAIWQDRPNTPHSTIYDHRVKYCGREYTQKISDVRSFLEKNVLSALFIASPDAVCWLYNLRAHDVEFTPLLLSFALITKEKSYLFIQQHRINDDLKKIRPDIEICDITKIEKYINEPAINSAIGYDPLLCSYYYTKLIKEKSNAATSINDPITRWKAIKNDTEIEYMQRGHISDAVAICEFLSHINSTNPDELKKINEFDLGKMLTKFRNQQHDYVMDSFPSICGYQDNGAVIHYRAEQKTAKYLSGSGLLLLDSGGQYNGATTDITRTIPIGSVPQEYKKYYTAVLRGHLQLGMIKFPLKSHITGAHLDVLARRHLWSMGLDYNHGTGHGVGAFLNVHEGPHSISLGSRVKIEAGMVMSNEPGYYKPGEFGIRIENMMYAKMADNINSNSDKENTFIEFEMLTLVPYCKDLINIDQLSNEEIDFLRKLYNQIEKEISPLLSSSAGEWLVREIDIF